VATADIHLRQDLDHPEHHVDHGVDRDERRQHAEPVALQHLLREQDAGGRDDGGQELPADRGDHDATVFAAL
jgi:hypothetical protein